VGVATAMQAIHCPYCTAEQYKREFEIGVVKGYLLVKKSLAIRYLT